MANTYDKNVIFDNVKIADVLAEHNIKLTPSGKGQAKCSIRPNDTQASCSVNLDKGIFRDFGSDVSGSVINLIAYLDLGIERKLDAKQFRDACSYIGDKYGLPPTSRSNDNVKDGVIEKWTAPDKYVFEILGLNADRAVANLIDLREMGSETALEQFGKLKDMSLGEFAERYRSSYVEILHKDVVRMIYNSKQRYQDAVLRLTVDRQNGKPDNEKLVQTAKDLYTKHTVLYNAFEKAVPYEIKTYNNNLMKDYSINPYQFNAYDVEEEIQHCIEGKYTTKKGKVNDYMIQFGNVPYSTLKHRATESNPIRYLDKLLTLTEINNLKKQMSSTGNIYRFAAISNGYNKPFKISVLNSDLEQLCKDIGITYNNVQTNERVFNQPSAKDKTGLSEFGNFFKTFCNQNGKSVKDVANDLGIDSRRISEALKYNVSNSPQTQEILSKLKDYTGFVDMHVQSYNTASYGTEYRKFSDLSQKERDVIVNKRYNHATNTNIATGGKICTREQIENTLMQLNDKYLYDKNLSMKSVNDFRTAGQGNHLMVQTMSYNDICLHSKSLDDNGNDVHNPFTVTLFQNDANTKKLVDAMKSDNISFSLWQQGSIYKLHIINTQSEKMSFMKASVKAQFPFLNAKGEIQNGLKKFQDIARGALKDGGMEYPNPYEPVNGSGDAKGGGHQI